MTFINELRERIAKEIWPADYIHNDHRPDADHVQSVIDDLEILASELRGFLWGETNSKK